MEDYYEYLDSNGVTTLYKLIKDDTVALIDSYSVTINGITTTLDNHVNNTDIHTPIATIEGMVDTKIAGLVNSAPETLDTLKELSDALGNDPNFATTVANQIGTKANKDSVYTKEETNALLEGKANSKHNHVVKDITDFPTIPTKTSELSNDSNFVTSTELQDYATKNDLNSKQDALSEEQLSNIDSIPDKANKSDLSTVATSGSYKDLLDKPVIPEGADLSDYYNKGETDNLLNSKANTSDLAVVAKSGNYNDLNNTPIIPTKTSELTNDSGYITSVSWEDVTSKPELSQVAISGSYSDLSDTPTIPTRTSQLINDSGFLTSSSGLITSVSWSDITNKPNFSTVATSGSYTDLSNTPAIPTKLSQLENDMGFGSGGDTSDCVHKTGNETIAGIKTFTNGTWVTNNSTTAGYSIKNTAIARNEVPTQLYHATFRAYDKNDKILGEYCVEKSTTGCTLLNMNVRSEDSNGNQLSESLYLNMSNDGSAVRFYPSSNNKVDLGMSNNKWAKIYSDDVVHTSGDETIAGNKTFSNRVSFPSGYYITTDANDNSLRITRDGSNHGNVYKIIIQGDTGKIFAPNGFKGNLQGNADTASSVPWSGVTNKPIIPTKVSDLTNDSNFALDSNLVHKTGDETISGAKIFLNDIFRKNTSADLTVTPTGYTNTNITFADKYDKTLALIEYVQRPSGVNDVGIFARDKNGNAHGIHINTDNEVIPLMSSSESYSLGSATYKWNNAYINRINCANIVSQEVRSTTANAFMAQCGGYTCTLRNDGSNTYLLMSAKDGTPGTWTDARPLQINNATGLCSINGNANSATYSTTPATTDNSTRIATTAWVRSYVYSVAGSNTIGSSVSAYWSNSANVTATGQASSGVYYPACYSDYITKTPTVGTIYSGAQLYTVLNTSASATGFTTGTSSGYIYNTNIQAQATFSNPISSTGKYLCTTANTVKFRAYTAKGSASAVGTSSVVDNSSTKSIFIRVE